MPFYVLSSYRAGSHFLASCLNSHKRILCEAEILNRGSWKKTPVHKNKMKLMQELHLNEETQNLSHLTKDFFRNDRKKGKRCRFGGLIKYEHLSKEIIRYLRQEEIPVIIICRKNTVKRELSFLISQCLRSRSNKQENIHYKESVLVEPVFFTSGLLQELKNRILNTRYEDQRHIATIGNRRTLVLQYEDLTGDQDTGFLTRDISKKLCRLLKVPTKILKSDIIKNPKAQPKNVVINYKEVLEFLVTEFKEDKEIMRCILDL